MKKLQINYSTEYKAPEMRDIVMKSSTRFLVDSKIGTAGNETTFTDEEW